MAICKEANECVALNPTAQLGAWGILTAVKNFSLIYSDEISGRCKAHVMGTQWKNIEGHTVLFQCGCLSEVTSARKIQHSHINHPPSTLSLLPDYRRDKVSLRDYSFLFLTLPGSCMEHASAKSEGLAMTREANCWRSPDGHSPAAR